MTATEIVHETLGYYTADMSRRALNCTGRCVIETEDGRRCALGRCMLDQYQREYFNSTGPELGDMYHATSIDFMLKPEYHGHTVEFWHDLQCVHDHGDSVERMRKLAEDLLTRIAANPSHYTTV